MRELGMLEEFLASGHVEASVFGLRPDYRAMLRGNDGILPGPSDQASHARPQAAEAAARETLHRQPSGEVAHVVAWREAHRAFGAKPPRTRNSLEALLRGEDGTTMALFILDALDPMTDQGLDAAAADLATHLSRLGPEVRVVGRLITAGATPVEGD